MKTEFISFKRQMEYMNKIISRDTTIEKKCQYCGANAQIKYVRDDVYHIQLICKKCKNDRKLLSYNKKDSFCSDIPIIDIRDYFNSKKKVLENRRVKNKDNDERIKFLLETKLVKSKALKELKISKEIYEDLLETYGKRIASNIEGNLHNNRINKIKTTKMNYYENKVDRPNNLYKIKKEKNLSNREIIKMSNGKFTLSHLSIISSGKSVPKIKTKCELAQVLGVSVADIFPEDYLFDKVYNYKDYLDYANKVKSKLYKYVSKRNRVYSALEELSNKTGISVNRLYNLSSLSSFPSHKEIENIEKVLKRS